MSLQAQQEVLFAPQAETLPVSVKGLDGEGFGTCIVGGRPCIHAVAIHPHRDPSASMLCCRRYGRIVSAEEASRCTSQA